MSDDKKLEHVPFDHDIDGVDDYDNQFGEEDTELNEENLDEVRGKSELANDRKMRIKGQKTLIIFMSLIAILAAAFMTYRIIGAKKSVETDKKQETKTDFKKPEGRTFGEQFEDLPTSATSYTVVDSATGGTENGSDTRGVTGHYPTTTVEPPPSYPSYSSNEVSRVSEPPSNNRLPTRIEPSIPSSPVSEPVTQVPALTPEEERQLRIYKSGFNFSQTSNNAASLTTKSSQDKDPLTMSLSPASLDGTSAVAMQNRDFVVTKGSTIDCVLNTKFDSTVIGMITCSVTRNVYGASGRVILIDRGSKVTGEYKGGMQQGQNRVFILWNRIETPKGVIIDINSPATGALGEAGADGRVNSKFFKRFGGAMLVSLVSDLGKAISEAAAEKTIGGNVSLEDSANTAQQMATAELEKSINIPPSLIKHQGDRLSIFVARDVYFGNVYQLKRKK